MVMNSRDDVVTISISLKANMYKNPIEKVENWSYIPSQVSFENIIKTANFTFKKI